MFPIISNLASAHADSRLEHHQRNYCIRGRSLQAWPWPAIRIPSRCRELNFNASIRKRGEVRRVRIDCSAKCRRDLLCGCYHLDQGRSDVLPFAGLEPAVRAIRRALVIDDPFAESAACQERLAGDGRRTPCVCEHRFRPPRRRRFHIVTAGLLAHGSQLPSNLPDACSSSDTAGRRLAADSCGAALARSRGCAARGAPWGCDGAHAPCAASGAMLKRRRHRCLSQGR